VRKNKKTESLPKNRNRFIFHVIKGFWIFISLLSLFIMKFVFEKDLQEILKRVKAYHPDFSEEDEKKISKAFEFAQKSHDGQIRFSGEPYFTHPVAATKILLSIQPDVETIIACLLHDVIEDTPVTAGDIEREFGSRICFLCEGVEKVSKVQVKKVQATQKFENIQKLFMAMGKDIRVIFVKLADRIHNLQTLQYVRIEKQQRIAMESLEIYAPVAEKLGLFEFKTEIENLCFFILHPNEAKSLQEDLAVCRKVRQKFIDRAKKEILRTMQEENFEIVKVLGREKHLYSIWEKMKRKCLDQVDEVYDLLGIRVIVKSREDCYRALGVFHGHWRQIPGRFKDYISVPKPNGYQSLHTTVLGLGQSKLPTEIQIRTEQMHMDAELGPAAHWAYKKTKHSDFDDDYLQRTSWLPREFMQNLTPEQFFQEISRSVFAEQIYVFTPKGEVQILSKGATAIDFAYSVHTEIGHSCVGVTVNGIIKPLDYELKNGDVVRVLTKKGRKPNLEWLKFVKSSSARTKIQQFIRRERDKEELEPLPEKEKRVNIIKIDKALESLQRRTKPVKSEEVEIIIGGATDIPYRIAPCCGAVFGKSVIAYKSRGLKFTIHEATCSELHRLDPERFFEAHFVRDVKFRIRSEHRMGLLRDCTTVIVEHGVNIKTLNVDKNSDKKTALWNFVVMVNSEKEVGDLLRDLERVPGVAHIEQLTK
jgi:GTP pyrophosphokinase